MKLAKMPKTTVKKKKRVGRGYGSGKGGHTAGRGQKGQKARSKVGLLFEGTKMRKSLIRRLPMRRGKGKLKSFKKKPVIINVKYLNLLKPGSRVTLESLVKDGLVSKKETEAGAGVKILGDGQLNKKLTVVLPVSQGAKKKIEKAGGKVVDTKKHAKGGQGAKRKKAEEAKKKPLKRRKKKIDAKNKKEKVNVKEVKEAKKKTRKTRKKKAAAKKKKKDE